MDRLSPATNSAEPFRRCSSRIQVRAVGSAFAMLASSVGRPQNIGANNRSAALPTIAEGNTYQSDNADDLVHPCRGPHLSRNQRRTRAQLVRIAQDGLSFIEPEIAVLENRNATERMPSQMLLALGATYAQRRQLIGNVPLLKAEKAPVRTYGLPGTP